MDWHALFIENWHVYAVAAMLIWCAWIDGTLLKVPNKLTFPFVITGFVYNLAANGLSEGLWLAFAGMSVGLLTLLPFYVLNWMGAGDVKMMAGMGAWLGPAVAWWAFVYTVFVGAGLAILMVLYRGDLKKHYEQFVLIWTEAVSLKSPAKIAEIAAERKSSMYLLPYGIPICIGSIAYFFVEGMLY
jgi:prepilin peptidase CpaA